MRIKFIKVETTLTGPVLFVTQFLASVSMISIIITSRATNSNLYKTVTFPITNITCVTKINT